MTGRETWLEDALAAMVGAFAGGMIVYGAASLASSESSSSGVSLEQTESSLLVDQASSWVEYENPQWRQQIDPKLGAKLEEFAQSLGRKIRVTGGFRTPEKTAKLVSEGIGASATSLHHSGKAVDIRYLNIYEGAELYGKAIDYGFTEVGFYAPGAKGGPHIHLGMRYAGESYFFVPKNWMLFTP